MTTAKRLFGSTAMLLELIDNISSIALKHNYSFISDQWFEDWLQSSEFTIERMNFIIALELIEKAHLASMMALLRAKRWAEAVCHMYEKENFLAWAAAFRGLLESAGDTLDALYTIPEAFARNHRLINEFLNGRSTEILNVAALEKALDHFVHAKWIRIKRNEENVLKARDNIDYVRNLEAAIPNVTNLYQQLCAICHPSSASLDYLIETTPSGGFKLSTRRDSVAITALVTKYPGALPKAMQANCTPPLLILRVLHKFKTHPQIAALKLIDWKHIEMASEIEHFLRN